MVQTSITPKKRRGGVGIEGTILFEKYELYHVIGQGRAGIVYLAFHRELEEYRAIKQVSKSFVGYERFRREAMILKHIRHPGIPIVYDVEEDENFSYLIEEFLEGESLYSLINQQGNLTRAMTIRYGIQICHLVFKLHSATPNPILYLDLQPKNLLLCHETVKLVDFDHAASLTDANASKQRYGTIGCAAPEQYTTKEELDERTDIYAIGAILHYLLTGIYPEANSVYSREIFGDELIKILKTCLQEKKENRYDDVKELCQELDQLQHSKTGVFKEKIVSSLRLAVVGSKSGAGATHLAVGISDYLRKIGYPNLYEEHNHSKAIQNLAACYCAGRDRYGFVRINNNVYKPQYGEAVKLTIPPYDFVIMDFGSDWKAALAQGADAVILVCDGKWWNLLENQKAIEGLNFQEKLFLVYNHCCEGVKLPSPKGVTGDCCFRMPFQSNPYQTNQVTASFYKALLARIVEGEENVSKKYGIAGVQNLWRRITGRLV